jgi:hypothetical protein
MPRSFVATEEQRQQVKSMAGYGLKQEQIATLMGLGSTTTLRKHFREELQRGPIEAKANVRTTLLRLAKSGRNPGVTIYWLKTFAGWSEKGKAPEPDGSREKPNQWIIKVYQPPRAPEAEQQLQEAMRELSPGYAESEEWEEATDERYQRPGFCPSG